MPNSFSALLGTVLIEANQANKYLTINQAIQELEIRLGSGVLDIVDDPPVSPADASLYLVGASPTGVFVGFEHHYAFFSNSNWSFLIPVAGLSTIVINRNNALYLYDATLNWIPYQPSITTVTQSTSFTLDETFHNQEIRIDATSGNITVTLEDPLTLGSSVNIDVLVKKVSATNEIDFVNLAESEGGGTKLTSQYQAVSLRYDGTRWGAYGTLDV